jgi:hypothetical protein
MGTNSVVVSVARIEKSILLIRNQKVMPDADLAELSGVETHGQAGEEEDQDWIRDAT